MEESELKQINLREYYPSYYAADTYINVPEEVFHIIVEDRRAEAALQRKKYRHRAQYSLDCSDQIEVMALAQPMNPEAILEKRQKRKELFDAVMALPDKQAKRIYARFYLGLTVKEIAELEGVHTSSVYDSIQRGLHQLKKSYKYFDETSKKGE